MKVCQLLAQVEKTSVFVSFYKKHLTCIDNWVSTSISLPANNDKNMKYDIVRMLHKVSFDEIAPFLSKSYDAGRRCDYLKELIEKYDLAKGLNQHNSIISISTSPKHPLKPRELETLQRLLSRSVNKPQFCLKADNTLGEDLRIDFAFYSM